MVLAKNGPLSFALLTAAGRSCRNLGAFLHNIDALDTVATRGLILGYQGPMRFTKAGITTQHSYFTSGIDKNSDLSLDDFYSFVIPSAVVEKLDYMHQIIGQSGGANAASARFSTKVGTIWRATGLLHATGQDAHPSRITS